MTAATTLRGWRMETSMILSRSFMLRRGVTPSHGTSVLSSARAVGDEYRAPVGCGSHGRMVFVKDHFGPSEDPPDLLEKSAVSHCQRKIEMSGFERDRNVRLQGWSGGGMYLFFLVLVLALGLARTLAANAG